MRRKVTLARVRVVRVVYCILQIAEFLQLQILSACALGSGKQSIGEVLLTFLALHAITQLFWTVKVLQVTNRNKSVSYGLLKAAIVTNIRVCLKF